jgi:hypothetical protein
MSQENMYKIKECNHNFHSNCLLEWFRSSKNTSCPYCRNNNVSSNKKFYDNNLLFNMKINYAKRKNAPQLFVKLVEKYKKNKKEYNEKLKEYKKIKKEKIDQELSYKEYHKQLDLLRHKRRRIFKIVIKSKKKYYDIKNTIELIPIKPIIIKTKKYNKK